MSATASPSSSYSREPSAQCAEWHSNHSFSEWYPSPTTFSHAAWPCRYCCYLYFQLKTHKEEATAAEDEGDDEGGEVRP